MATPFSAKTRGSLRVPPQLDIPKWNFKLLNSSLASCSNAPLNDSWIHDKLKNMESLSKTNPYLKDPEKRRKALLITVLSSAAIETRGISSALFDKFIPRKTSSASMIIRESEESFE